MHRISMHRIAMDRLSRDKWRKGNGGRGCSYGRGFWWIGFSLFFGDFAIY
jgi:hypothetical protein